MKLTDSDIMAIAKDRVKLAESKKTNYVSIGAMALMAAGVGVILYLPTIGRMPGLGITSVAFLVYMWYANSIDAKVKALSVRLKQEWMNESKDSVQR